MTIEKQKLKALAESPRCGASWPQFESICGKTKSGKSTWQCGECARKEARDLREKLEKYFGLYKDADEHANHWQRQSRSKARLLKTAEQQCDQLKADNEALRKDAERYRFVRNPIGTSSPLAIWNEGRMPVFSAITDAIVDEFMAKEASHG